MVFSFKNGFASISLGGKVSKKRIQILGYHFFKVVFQILGCVRIVMSLDE